MEGGDKDEKNKIKKIKWKQIHHDQEYSPDVGQKRYIYIMQTAFNKKMVLVESEVHCWSLYQKIERWKLVNGNISFRPK